MQPFTVEEPWFSMHDRAAMPDPVPVAGPGKPGFLAAYPETMRRALASLAARAGPA